MWGAKGRHEAWKWVKSALYLKVACINPLPLAACVSGLGTVGWRHGSELKSTLFSCIGPGSDPRAHGHSFRASINPVPGVLASDDTDTREVHMRACRQANRHTHKNKNQPFKRDTYVVF